MDSIDAWGWGAIVAIVILIGSAVHSVFKRK